MLTMFVQCMALCYFQTSLSYKIEFLILEEHNTALYKPSLTKDYFKANSSIEIFKLMDMFRVSYFLDTSQDNFPPCSGHVWLIFYFRLDGAMVFS